MTQPPAHTPLLVSGHIIVNLCAAVNRQVGRFSLSGQGWDRVAHLASLPSLIHSPGRFSPVAPRRPWVAAGAQAVPSGS